MLLKHRSVLSDLKEREKKRAMPLFPFQKVWGEKKKKKGIFCNFSNTDDFLLQPEEMLELRKQLNLILPGATFWGEKMLYFSVSILVCRNRLVLFQCKYQIFITVMKRVSLHVPVSFNTLQQKVSVATEVIYICLLVVLPAATTKSYDLETLD